MSAGPKKGTGRLTTHLRPSTPPLVDHIMPVIFAEFIRSRMLIVA